MDLKKALYYEQNNCNLVQVKVDTIKAKRNQYQNMSKAFQDEINKMNLEILQLDENSNLLGQTADEQQSLF